MSIGAQLAARRGELGLTTEQAASTTRIRVQHLDALERDAFAGFAAPVYARGYLITYARFLELDPEPLITLLPRAPESPRFAPVWARTASGRRPLITTSMVVAASLVLVAGGLAGYMWRQVLADQQLAGPAAAPAMTTPPVRPRPIVIGVRVSEPVWINASVDGRPEYGDAGQTLPAGSIVYLTGMEIKLTSGKASATFITIDGHSLGPMGVGVATREFSSQTSPW